jgi:hypothetical protein
MNSGRWVAFLVCILTSMFTVCVSAQTDETPGRTLKRSDLGFPGVSHGGPKGLPQRQERTLKISQVSHNEKQIGGACQDWPSEKLCAKKRCGFYPPSCGDW